MEMFQINDRENVAKRHAVTKLWTVFTIDKKQLLHVIGMA